MGEFIYKSKKIHYRSKGNGDLMIILPGNTAASIAYKNQLDYFSNRFFAVSLDYLGTGASDRISETKNNWWKFSSRQVNALIEHLGYKKAIIAGSSGGAVVAMHLAADLPEKVSHLVLDSFSEKFTHEMFQNNVKEQRTNPSEMQKQFWHYCHGDGWESVIEQDTENIKRIVENDGNWLEDAPLRVKCPVLLLGSKEDSFIPGIEHDYKHLNIQMQDCRYVLSEKGDHPLIWTNPDFYNAELLKFLNTEITNYTDLKLN